MNLAAIFIRRPVMTWLVMFGMLIFGILAYRELPVSDLPNVDFPTLVVSAQVPGANPETMASAVATPLERQFSTIAGLDSMTSSNALGSTQITLQFSLGRNIDAAAQDVQSAISQAQSQLPVGMPTPPSFRKVNPADQPVLYLALNSPTMRLSDVDEYAETMIAQRISMVGGVAQVQVQGSQKYAVRAQIDPREIARRGIGMDEIASAIQGANVNLPTGVLEGRRQSLTVRADGQLLDAAAYAPVVVAYRNGSPVRLRELGRVIDSVEDDKIASWFNGRRGIVLSVFRQPGTNTVEVVDQIRLLLPKFREQIPASVSLDVLFDRSLTIRESVDDVKFTLLLTIGLVVAVIFIFLRNISATLIPSLAVPMSIVGTFAAMQLLGFSLDNLSLMALTLSVGFVVDDAIVMLENIVRHLEAGKSPMQASLDGSREIAFTILSMTISLAAVFLPVVFLGGLLGRLLREFAVTIAVAIIVSGIISLSLTPMLCSRFLKAHASEKHGRLYQMSERAFLGVQGAYGWTLTPVLKHSYLTLAASAVILVLTVQLFIQSPKGFMPDEDIGSIFAFTEAAQGISYQSMAEHQQAVAAVIGADPDVQNAISSVGASGPNASLNTGRAFFRLKPRNQRKRSAQDVIDDLRPKLAAIPGITVYLQIPPTIRIGGTLTKSPYQFTLQGPDTKELYAAVPALEDKLRQLPQLRDVTSDLLLKSPQVNLHIDRDRAATLGVTPLQIEDALYSSLGARQVSTIYAPNNEYRVILELLPERRDDPDSLSMIYVRSSAGALVPLETLARIERGIGPLTVNHLGQLPAVTCSFGLAPGASLGEAVEAVSKTARASLPASISTSFQGAAQAFEASLRGLGVLLIIAILVIYLVLGILYESFIHPITILSGLPSAGLGALVTLKIFHVDLNVYAFVGIIMLIGIVKKNAIMMIDFALEAQRSGGRSPRDAIFEGCLVRFRPIMMTTMAALMGTLPIAFGAGAGSESRRGLGLAVVGGLLFSQLVTLYLTPVVYVELERLRGFVNRLRERPSTEANVNIDPSVST
ncbi:MAG: efflux RND transporter permease subunit [Planctomycetes bacterium]|nr:efflux RND transporter permease subunit [Planctomycetota bacterium]